MAFATPTLVNAGIQDLGNDQNSFVTASVNPAAGGLLILFVSIGSDLATDPGNTPTASGLSGTWTRHESVATTDGGADLHHAIFTCSNYSGSGAITVTYAQDFSLGGHALIRISADSSITINDTNIAQGTNTSMQVTITGTNGAVLYGGCTGYANRTHTPLSGFTELHDAQFNSFLSHTSGYDITTPSNTAGTTVSGAITRWIVSAIGLTEGSQTVSPSTLSASVTINEPIVVFEQFITPSTISVGAVNEPAIAFFVFPNTISASVTINDPTVVDQGSLSNILPITLSTTPIIESPGVFLVGPISPDTIAITPTVNTPFVSTNIEMELLSVGVTIYNPEIISLTQLIEPNTINATSIVFTPSIDDGNEVGFPVDLVDENTAVVQDVVISSTVQDTEQKDLLQDDSKHVDLFE